MNLLKLIIMVLIMNSLIMSMYLTGSAAYVNSGSAQSEWERTTTPISGASSSVQGFKNEEGVYDSRETNLVLSAADALLDLATFVALLGVLFLQSIVLLPFTMWSYGSGNLMLSILGTMISMIPLAINIALVGALFDVIVNKKSITGSD